jgi:hypothetical protein
MSLVGFAQFQMKSKCEYQLPSSVNGDLSSIEVLSEYSTHLGFEHKWGLKQVLSCGTFSWIPFPYCISHNTTNLEGDSQCPAIRNEGQCGRIQLSDNIIRNRRRFWQTT